MPDKIFCELDPVFETMGLLFVSCNQNAVKQETIKTLKDLGYNGEQFYAQQFKTFEKYLQAFQKYRVESENDELFFGEKDSNYCLIVLSLIIENRSWLTSAVELTDDQINARLIDTCKAVFDIETDTEVSVTLDGIIQFLEGCELETNAKWKMLRIMRQPQKYVAELIEIIHSNMSACRKAADDVCKPLEKLLNQYRVLINNKADKKFYELKTKFSQSSAIYPTLIFPVSQMLFETGCYYGLLCEKVIKNGKTRLPSRESLLIRLKALSDSSKLEIISSLKISPKYNLEIAQQLGLTAATMSHHMNFLLNCGFVGIEKKDGKVYYHLEKENLKELITELEKTLL